jgi:hypothetical protein
MGVVVLGDAGAHDRVHCMDGVSSFGLGILTEAAILLLEAELNEVLNIGMD